VNKKSAALARIRHMAHLGLSPHIFIPAVLHEMSRLIPGSAAAFFWLDERGLISNCYAPRLPERADAFTRLARQGPPSHEQVVESNALFYTHVFEVNGATHGVHSEVHGRGGARGRLYVFRREGGKPFHARDHGTLETATRYIGRGMSAEASATPVQGGVSGTTREELIVCDTNGRIVHATAGGRTLMLFAAGVAITPDTMSAALERGREVLRSLCAKVPKHEPEAARVRHVIENFWGRFGLEIMPLGDGASPSAFFGIQIRQHKLATLHLLDAMERTGLSSRQREIALMVSSGLGNREIAHDLELSVNTVAYHMKCVFQKLGVRDRRTMLARLMDTDTAAFS